MKLRMKKCAIAKIVLMASQRKKLKNVERIE